MFSTIRQSRRVNDFGTKKSTQFGQYCDFGVSTTWGLDRLFGVCVPPYAKRFKIREFQPSSFAIKKTFPHVYKSLLALQALFSYTKNTVMSKIVFFIDFRARASKRDSARKNLERMYSTSLEKIWMKKLKI